MGLSRLDVREYSQSRPRCPQDIALEPRPAQSTRWIIRIGLTVGEPLPRATDIVRPVRLVRFVPGTDSCNAQPSESCLFLPLEHSPAEACLAREQRARCRYRLNKELIAFDSKVTPLFGAVPGLIPGDID